jgi:hypothetical protein
MLRYLVFGRCNKVEKYLAPSSTDLDNVRMYINNT